MDDILTHPDRNGPMTASTRPITALVAAALVAASLAAFAGPAAAATPTCFGKPATIVGTADADVIDLTGNPGQVVVTGAGDDEVTGSDGKDIVCLGSGDDLFIGKDGNDKVSAGKGNDTIDGGPGNDTVKGKRGDDEIQGGPGDDDLRGGIGQDHVSGGEGDDVVKGGTGNDRLNGGDATTSVGTSGDDHIKGGKGYDRLWSNYNYGDVDPDGHLNGGPDYDYCGSGAVQRHCERDHYSSPDASTFHNDPENFDPTANEWYPMIDDIFTAWGLDQEECATHPDAAGDDVELCIGDQRANAVKVLMCESNGWPFAQNGTSGTAGLFQNHPLYWPDRVTHLVDTYGSGNTGYPEVQFAPLFPSNADPFDPEWNAVVAAMLVYETRQTLLLQDPAPNYSYRYVGGWYYPTFNFDNYQKHYYDRYNPDEDPPGTPTEIIYGGYANGGEGPEPWGQWVSCGAMTTVWAQGQGLYDPGWLSPWEFAGEFSKTPEDDPPHVLPEWWPVPPWPPEAS